VGRLALPDSPRKLVFRRIVQQLKNDPVLKRSLKTLLAWGGTPEDARPLTIDESPGIRLTPGFGPDVWQFPDAQAGWMFIKVEMLVPGFDVGDMIDLWWALEIALYPRDWNARMAFQQALREVGLPQGLAGAKTGLITFSQPIADDAPADQYQHAVGEMKVEILLNLNT
jgi:hypothetical protein